MSWLDNAAGLVSSRSLPWAGQLCYLQKYLCDLRLAAIVDHSWSRSLCCGFQPLYGTSTGVQLDKVMRTVSMAPIPGRVGQRVRNELIFATTGGGYSDAKPQYRLEIAIRESVKDVFVARRVNPRVVRIG